jgi:hypothetical protein
MAFARSGLCRIGGSGTGGSTWQYSSADAKATVAGADYFLSANDELDIGDVIIGVDTSTPATPEVFITYVKAQSATSITAAGGLVVTA